MNEPSKTSSNKTPKCPSIVNNVYFTYMRTEKSNTGGDRLVVKCLLCTDEREVSGSFKSTGNFLQHLQRYHLDAHEEYKKGKESKVDDSQPRLGHLITSVTKGIQKEAARLVTNYIVNSMLPLSTVNNPEFIKMVQGLTQDKTLKVITRYQLDQEINLRYNDMIDKSKAQLSAVDYVCLTADVWSSRAKSYLGVTCHWLDVQSFKRESLILSCVRFTGCHSYDRIAMLLNDAMNKYELSQQKVVCITTDNGSNFCKAFREFGQNFEDVVQTLEDERILVEPGEENFDFDEEQDDNGEEESENSDDVYHNSLNSILSGPSAAASNQKITLPPHFRCASHTLSLIATKDIYQANEKALYHKAIGKCTKLWNLSTSPKSSEKIIATCGKNFKRPVETRWNSLYDSLERLLEMAPNLNLLCDELSKPKFSEREMNFLQEFVKVSKPVAEALDELQGEVEVYMGDLLPSIFQIRKSLLDMKDSIVTCTSILNAYLEGINRRFASVMDIDSKKPSNYLFAAMSHPYFKIRWIKASDDVISELKKAFVSEAKKFAENEKKIEPSNEPESKRRKFFDFDSLPSNSGAEDVEVLCYRYFNDSSTELSMLKSYPPIEKMFRRYNTALPSSAPVERLFSYGGLILTSKRSRLSDSKFEKLLLLKCNNCKKL